MTSFRDVEAFDELIVLYNAFPDNLKDNVVAKQQFDWPLTVGTNQVIATKRFDELMSC